MGDQRWALVFDGTDDYVTVPHQTPLDVTTAVTVQAWFYFQGGISGYRLDATLGSTLASQSTDPTWATTTWPR